MKKLMFLLFFIFAAVAIGEDNVTIPTVNLSLSAPMIEIGRASCRERV